MHQSHQIFNQKSLLVLKIRVFLLIEICTRTKKKKSLKSEITRVNSLTKNIFFCTILLWYFINIKNLVPFCRNTVTNKGIHDHGQMNYLILSKIEKMRNMKIRYSPICDKPTDIIILCTIKILIIII